MQELSSTWTASIKSIDISEYTPIEANKSKLHDIGQFEALYGKFATHCDLPSFNNTFSGKCVHCVKSVRFINAIT